MNLIGILSANRMFSISDLSTGFCPSFTKKKHDRCSNHCARLVYHNAQPLHNRTGHKHNRPRTTLSDTITHIHKLEAHSQLKLFISPYEMRLLFLSPSLSLSGGIHMDKRRGKWVFRGAITSSQGGNNANNVLYEACRAVGHQVG